MGCLSVNRVNAGGNGTAGDLLSWGAEPGFLSTGTEKAGPGKTG